MTLGRRPPRVPTRGGQVEAPRRGRLSALDGLRFLAAIAVVGYHYTAHGHPHFGPQPSIVFPTLSEFTAYGALGPKLFFVISGFVILMTAWGRDIPGYIASRISRLFPAYWAAVLSTTFLLFVLWPEKKGITSLDALVNLTMVQKAFSVPHVDGVYWTLWVELRFYLLIAIFAAIGITRQRVLAFAALWPVLAKLAMRSDATLVHTLVITEYASLFAGGMLLYLIYREGHSFLPWLLVGMNAILAVQSQLASQVTSLTEDTGVAVSKALVAALLVGCFAAVAVVTMTPVARLDWKWLTTLGALTYPLYLVHEYWGWWIISRLHEAVGPYLALLAAVAFSTALACAILYGVERRFAEPLRGAVLRSLLPEPRTGGEAAGGSPVPTAPAPVAAQIPGPTTGVPQVVPTSPAGDVMGARHRAGASTGRSAGRTSDPAPLSGVPVP
jgi:peptidoglycan/LPS O-acetylase OafA/YrhL